MASSLMWGSRCSRTPWIRFSNVSWIVPRARCKASATLPGKLGDPNMTLMTEPRMDPTLLNHFKKDLILGKWGVVGKPIPFPFDVDAAAWKQHKWNEILEKYMLPKIFNPGNMPMPDTSSIEQYTEIISGADGNNITLYIAKPKDAVGLVPGILHTHGGGMAIMSANDHNYRVYRAALASQGFAVVSVEFRNSSGLLGRHPYPAGLTDCMSGLAWTSSNREKLGISKLVLSGESGGGNLCSAMAIRAKRESRLQEFDGVFAMCPFIAGPEAWKSKSLTSMTECDEYFVDMYAFRTCAKLYDPDYNHLQDPCAWPLNAKPADLEGLPPHIISVNELDPLRDEGLLYCEKLREAGVSAESRVVKATPHGADVACSSIPGCEHIFEETVASLKTFVSSL